MASIVAEFSGLGAVLTRQDRGDEALKVLGEALATNREYDQQGAEADSLSALGAAALGAGELEESNDWYQRCVEQRRKLGDRAGEGWAFLYEHINLSDGIGAGDSVSRGQAIGTSAITVGTNHMALEYLFNGYAYTRDHQCWVGHLAQEDAEQRQAQHQGVPAEPKAGIGKAPLDE